MSIFFSLLPKRAKSGQIAYPRNRPSKNTLKRLFDAFLSKNLKRWLRRISFGPVSKSTASTHFFFYPPLRRISFSKRVRSSTHFFTLNTKRLKSQRNASKRFKLKEMRRKQQTLGKKKEKRRRGDIFLFYVLFGRNASKRVTSKRNASKSEKMGFLHSRFRGYGNGRKWLQSKKKMDIYRYISRYINFLYAKKV